MTPPRTNTKGTKGRPSPASSEGIARGVVEAPDVGKPPVPTHVVDRAKGGTFNGEPVSPTDPYGDARSHVPATMRIDSQFVSTFAARGAAAQTAVNALGAGPPAPAADDLKLAQLPTLTEAAFNLLRADARLAGVHQQNYAALCALEDAIANSDAEAERIVRALIGTPDPLSVPYKETGEFKPHSLASATRACEEHPSLIPFRNAQHELAERKQDTGYQLARAEREYSTAKHIARLVTAKALIDAGIVDA